MAGPNVATWGCAVPLGAEQGRFIPVPADATFQALAAVVQRAFKVRSADHFMRSLSFSSSMSATSYGENYYAQVMPAEGGSMVNIMASNKNPVQLSSRGAKIIDRIFHDLSMTLQHGAPPVVPAGPPPVAVAGPPPFAVGSPPPVAAGSPPRVVASLPSRTTSSVRGFIWIVVTVVILAAIIGAFVYAHSRSSCPPGSYHGVNGVPEPC